MWRIAAETDENPRLRESTRVTMRAFCIFEEASAVGCFCFILFASVSCWNTEESRAHLTRSLTGLISYLIP